jgi:hypothetical protein
MEKMIAYCGINCAGCPSYLATQKDDDSMRKQVQDLWKNQFNVDLKLEDINCDGCKGGGKLGFYCKACGIKKCAEGKNLENCAYCEDYACDKLNNLFAMLPPDFSGKETLDEIKSNI